MAGIASAFDGGSDTRFRSSAARSNAGTVITLRNRNSAASPCYGFTGDSKDYSATEWRVIASMFVRVAARTWLERERSQEQSE